MKKFILFLMLYFIVACYFNDSPEVDNTPEKEVTQNLVIDRDYKGIILDNLKRTEKSVKVVMFVIKYSDDIDSPVREILTEILSLKSKGVDIKFIMDKTTAVDYPQTTNFLIKNEIFFKLYSNVTLHTKMVILDDKVVIFGSHNWTDSALNLNREVSFLTTDEKIVEKSKNYFEKIYSE